MKFRKIYWVTEQVDSDLSSEVTGVYTSVPDLAEKGITFHPESTKTAGFRLSLVQLDVPGVLGTWESPSFEGLAEDMARYQETGELSEHDKDLLLAGLKSLNLQGAAPSH